MLEVIILSAEKVIFEGKAKGIVLPGNEGVFEILPFHQPLFSRLLKGNIMIDGQLIPIQRGLVKVKDNKATILIEEAFHES